MGIRDPSTMNKILSAKIWWRWMKRPQDLWRIKYTPNMAERNVIRWNRDNLGSLFWMIAKHK